MSTWPEFLASLTLAAWAFTGCFAAWVYFTDSDDDDGEPPAAN
jgi:CHASE2 domain-containing sensor protein